MLTFESLIPSAPKQRFSGINRTYTPQEVHRLRGSLHIQHTLAEAGANRLWALLHDEPFVASLGAATGNQAMQMVRAGLQCIYLSGWQVAADNNTAGAMFPDQSLYPSSSGPELCRRINRTLSRANPMGFWIELGTVVMTVPLLILCTVIAVHLIRASTD